MVSKGVFKLQPLVDAIQKHPNILGHPAHPAPLGRWSADRRGTCWSKFPIGWRLKPSASSRRQITGHPLKADKSDVS